MHQTGVTLQLQDASLAHQLAATPVVRLFRDAQRVGGGKSRATPEPLTTLEAAWRVHEERHLADHIAFGQQVEAVRRHLTTEPQHSPDSIYAYLTRDAAIFGRSLLIPSPRLGSVLRAYRTQFAELARTARKHQWHLRPGETDRRATPSWMRAAVQWEEMCAHIRTYRIRRYYLDVLPEAILPVTQSLLTEAAERELPIDCKFMHPELGTLTAWRMLNRTERIVVYAPRPHADAIASLLLDVRTAYPEAFMSSQRGPRMCLPLPDAHGSRLTGIYQADEPLVNVLAGRSLGSFHKLWATIFMAIFSEAQRRSMALDSSAGRAFFDLRSRCWCIWMGYSPDAPSLRTTLTDLHARVLRRVTQCVPPGKKLEDIDLGPALRDACRAEGLRGTQQLLDEVSLSLEEFHGW